MVRECALDRFAPAWLDFILEASWLTVDRARRRRSGGDAQFVYDFKTRFHHIHKVVSFLCAVFPLFEELCFDPSCYGAGDLTVTNSIA